MKTLSTLTQNPIRLAQVVLWLYAALLVVFGVPAILAPTPRAATVEALLPTATARIDFAATYGGAVFGLAAFLVYCVGHPARLRLGLLANACFLAGYAITRGLGLLLAHGAVRPILYLLLAIETSGAVLSVGAARKL